MKNRILLFVIMLIIIVILFLFLYFIGIINLFSTKTQFLKNYPLFDFGKPVIAIFYLIILTIFFILVIAIMIRLIISLRNDSIKLTQANIEEFSLNKTKNLKEGEEQQNYNNKQEINYYKNTKSENFNNEEDLQEKIDSIYQNFSDMISDILQTDNISDLFDKILQWGVSLSNSKRGSLMVVDRNNYLYIYKTIGWSKEEKLKIKEIKIKVGEGISGKVAKENKRIFITNIDNSDFDYKYKDKYQTKSFISLPISGVHKVIAVLNLTENKNNYYSIGDLESLNILTKLGSKIFELIQLKKRNV